MTELQKELETVRYAIDSLIRRYAVPEAKPLFTTEDGVDIYRGDNYVYVVIDDNYSIRGNQANVHCGKKDEHKYFSTREMAQVWVLMNKPCLSVMDVDSAYNFAPKCSPLHEDLMLNLEAIAKSRL